MDRSQGWVVGGDTGYGALDGTRIKDKRTDLVLAVTIGDVPELKARENAKLIVRAVNAHDALLAFAEYVIGTDPTNRAPLFEKARAVIALANGGADSSTQEPA